MIKIELFTGNLVELAELVASGVEFEDDRGSDLCESDVFSYFFDERELYILTEISDKDVIRKMIDDSTMLDCGNDFATFLAEPEGEHGEAFDDEFVKVCSKIHELFGDK